MDKKKFETIIFIILVAVGINYVLYAYYVEPQRGEIKTASDAYDKLKEEVAEESINKERLNDLKNDAAEKKKQAYSTNIIFQDTDNQTIIKEFYAACKQYGVKGDTLQFAFKDTSSADTNSPSASGSLGDISTNNDLTGIQTNLITLTLSGEKGKIENFINHVRQISKRKLLINSIQLNSLEANGISLSNSADTSGQVVSAKVVLTEFIYKNTVGAAAP